MSQITVQSLWEVGQCWKAVPCVLCACLYTSVGGMCVCARVWKSEDRCRCHFLGIICFIFTYPGPLIGPELTAWAKLSSQQILRISYFYLPSTRLTRSHHQSWLFIWLLESSAGPQDNHFTNWALFPVPQSNVFFKISSLKYILK